MTIPVRMTLLSVILIAVVCILVGCSDDESNPTIPTRTISSYDEVHPWDCENSVDCQDVFDIEFAAGAIVDFSATETTGGSVLQIALYAPAKALGGTNLFTDDATELRCDYVVGCNNNTAGQTVSGFVIPAAGTYRLAVTRDWGGSCGGEGTYRLLIDADKNFSPLDQTVDDVATLATDWSCPAEEAMHYDEVQAWDCALSTDCQDVYDIDLTAGTTVDFSATEVTGNSVLQIALYAPGTALGGTNMFTGTANELRCNFVNGCSNNPDGQTVNGVLIDTTGTYRLAITRDWGNSCGGSGTYRLIIDADEPMGEVTQTLDDTPSEATDWECP